MNEVLNYLNDTNKKIVSFIEQYVPVIFTKKECDNYESQMHKKENGSPKSAEIFYKEPLEQAKFAHELMHMKTDLMIGDDQIVYEISLSDRRLSKIIDEQFCADLLNVTQHVVFAPEMKELGYGMEQFEYETLNPTIKSIYNDALETKLKFMGVYDSTRVQCYIKLLLMYMFYPDDKRFTKEINALKTIDFVLFSIVKKLHIAFEDLELDERNKDYIQNQYREFAEGIQKWIHKHMK